MSVTVSSFLAQFPEFSDDRAPVDLIQAMIDDAALLVSAETWGDKRDIGIKYMAAHLIANSPWGQQARLVPDSTTYEQTFKRHESAVVLGVAVAVTCPPIGVGTI